MVVRACPREPSTFVEDDPAPSPACEFPPTNTKTDQAPSSRDCRTCNKFGKFTIVLNVIDIIIIGTLAIITVEKNRIKFNVPRLKDFFATTGI